MKQRTKSTTHTPLQDRGQGVGHLVRYKDEEYNAYSIARRPSPPLLIVIEYGPNPRPPAYDGYCGLEALFFPFSIENTAYSSYSICLQGNQTLQCIYVSKQKINIVNANMYFDIYLVPAQSDLRAINSNWVQLQVLQLQTQYLLNLPTIAKRQYRQTMLCKQAIKGLFKGTLCDL